MFSYLQQPKGFYKRLFLLALPIIVQNLITTSLGFLDTFMVGLLGSEQMSAVTVANVPVFIIQLIVFGLQSGSSVLISQYWGRGDRESINRVMGIGLYIAGGISILFALVMALFPAGVLLLVTDNLRLVEIGTPYIRIVGFSYILNSLSSIYIGMQRSIENPRFGMLVFGASMLCNTVGNYVLIFGKLGFTVADGPDIETRFNNFTALNTPDHHPTNDRTDTFWLDSAEIRGEGDARTAEDLLLRTQTSPVQIRTMLANKPPVRVICPGRTYRRYTTDATHSANFHQIEGLYCDTKPVSLADLKSVLAYFAKEMMGDSVTVPSIDGKVEYTVPEGTQSGTTFRLRGKGIQYLNGRGRGDMYVKCEVEIPKKLNKAQRDALKKFEGTLKEENYEKRKGFFKKLKDMFNS